MANVFTQTEGQNEQQTNSAPEQQTQFRQPSEAQPEDVSALQMQLARARAEAAEAKVMQQATLEAVTMGIDVKAIPYVLRILKILLCTGKDAIERLQEKQNK